MYDLLHISRGFIQCTWHSCYYLYKCRIVGGMARFLQTFGSTIPLASTRVEIYVFVPTHVKD